MKRSKGFTLIELLVVLAIISILSAIAVPNFLEAQIRSKVSRVKSDLRTVALALESYHVDYNTYIAGNHWGVAAQRPGVSGDLPVLERLSTPIAYLSQALLPNIFTARRRSDTSITGIPPLQVNYSLWVETPTEEDPEYFLYRTYLYIATTNHPDNKSGIDRVLHTDGRSSNGFIIYAAGPNEDYINAGGVVANADQNYATDLIYDPTNGTVSFGNIWRSGGSPDNRDNIIGAITKAL